MKAAIDNLRLGLWFTVAVLAWACFQAWQLDYAPPRTFADAVEKAAPEPTQDPAARLPALPQQPSAAATTPDAAAQPIDMPKRAPVHVRTDVLDVELDPLGGDLMRVSLPKYPVHKDQPDVPVVLLNPDAADLFLFHTGLRTADGMPEPNHLTPMHTAQSEYALGDGDDDLAVTFTWEAPGQVAVDKIYHFRRGHYDIGLEYRVRNLGTEPYTAASYLQIERLHHPPERSYFNVDSYSFTGPVTYDGKKYEKLDVGDIAKEPFRQKLPDGWLASIQHHFLAAVVPPADQEYSYEAAAQGGIYTLTAIGPLTTVAPGAEETLNAKLFVGPKLQAQLEEVADGLKLTVDYGRLTILAQPLFWLLQQIHNIVGNWGWSIIIATFLIKLVFYKLTETSGRSMARMRKLQPRMTALQERYKDDRQQLSQALMDLYKREKVNPAAGCLPMLIQIPFFIAFYWVLLESVEMRQAPFALWITDLSARDPFFILPLLMAAAMWFQTSLNPAPPDPMQAKIMKWMPMLFAGMFAFFPAGLVLYWFTNSVLSIAQQWNINRKLAVE
ncbi:MAG: membrane protein insertase YidC [Gammaproteobacteria bacterium]|nr:MAG: membrane protein insertase YidC [Gammaproteobacteria bacterium]